MTDILNFRRVHLMGIGGAGMSALAKLLHAHGLDVTGCDLHESHYDLGGISCIIGHSQNHITDLKPDALVLSSAVHRDNPEVLCAQSLNIPIFSRAEALSSLFNQHSGIGVAGAHGKTTTSSMTSLIFLEAGKNPTVYIGANVPDIGSNALSGTGEYFIAELDESDGTFELFHPQIAVITNADWDHVDHYPTRELVLQAFTRYADGRKSGGTLILCAEDDGAKRVYDMCSKSRGGILRYGWGKNHDWGASNLEARPGGGISCTVWHNGQESGRLELSVSGSHNVLNALAAIAAADLCGIDFKISAGILKNFHGSERRMQLKGKTDNNILVMDDYAHHPSEIRATLNAVRGIYPDRRIVTVYQPHRFSRTAKFAPEIAHALSLSDRCFVLPVYSAGESVIPHSSSGEIVSCSDGKIDSADFGTIGAILNETLASGDILLTMGAGNVYEIGEKFLNESQNI